jgi:hypothetical protein
MTKDEALKLALEALDSKYIVGCSEWRGQQLKALTAIKEALAQPTQEPVAWADMNVTDRDVGLSWTPGQFHTQPLYTAPQPAHEPDTNAETVTYVADVLAGKKRKEKNK